MIATFGRRRVRWRTRKMVGNSLDGEESDADERHDKNERNDFVERRKCRAFKTPRGIYVVISDTHRFRV